MFPKKGQVWTHKERGRLWGLVLGIAAIVSWIFAVIVFVTTSNWLILLLAVVMTGCAIVYAISNERRYRGEP